MHKIQFKKETTNEIQNTKKWTLQGGFAIMGGSGGPSGGITRVDNVRSLKPTGKPNSRVDRYEKGKLVQQRWYGPDGKAVRNRDYEHQDAHNNHEFPHDHPWDWTKVPPRLESVEPDYNWN